MKRPDGSTPTENIPSTKPSDPPAGFTAEAPTPTKPTATEATFNERRTVRDAREAEAGRDYKPGQYVVARARLNTFTRAGIRFGSDYQAIKVEDLTNDQIRRILEEPSLDARLMSESEMRQIVDAQAEPADAAEGNASRAELLQHVMALREENRKLSDRVKQLEGRAAGDSPPKRGEDPRNRG